MRVCVGCIDKETEKEERYTAYIEVLLVFWCAFLPLLSTITTLTSPTQKD